MSAATASALATAKGWSATGSSESHAIQDVIDMLYAAVDGAPFPNTVDTVKSGDPTQRLKGVVTTFMANVGVVEQAIAKGANLIVTHEPTYYNHRDDTDWLADDHVCQAKAKLLEDHGIVTFRYHDTMHAIRPDPVRQALVDQLGWADGQVSGSARMFEIPARGLGDLVSEIKTKLSAPMLRVVGDLDQECHRIGVLPGAVGGHGQISFLSSHPVDTLVVGEIAEWETSEYVRDANRVGRPLGLIILGHSVSESLGMKWLTGWLQEGLPGVPVDYVPAPAPFQYL